MRRRLILLISEHPIQQGIRKGGVRIFGHGRTDEDGRTDGRTGSGWGLYFHCTLRKHRRERIKRQTIAEHFALHSGSDYKETKEKRTESDYKETKEKRTDGQNGVF